MLHERILETSLSSDELQMLFQGLSDGDNQERKVKYQMALGTPRVLLAPPDLATLPMFQIAFGLEVSLAPTLLAIIVCVGANWLVFE